MTTRDTPFGRGLLNLCTAMVSIFAIMNSEPRKIPKLHYLHGALLLESHGHTTPHFGMLYM